MRAVPATPQQLPLLCAYIKEKTEADIDPSLCQGFAVMSDEGAFCAAVIVSNFRAYNGRPVDCEISVASETPSAWRPTVCKAVFEYVFNKLGCVRCTSIVKKNNNKSRSFLEGFKFQLEGNVRRGYDGDKDALIYGLLAVDCEFLGG